jgi:hypothetical protein
LRFDGAGDPWFLWRPFLLGLAVINGSSASNVQVVVAVVVVVLGVNLCVGRAVAVFLVLWVAEASMAVLGARRAQRPLAGTPRLAATAGQASVMGIELVLDRDDDGVGILVRFLGTRREGRHTLRLCGGVSRADGLCCG